MSKIKVKPIQFCPLCGGSGLVEKGDETDTCPMCKGERHSNNHPTTRLKKGLE